MNDGIIITMAYPETIVSHAEEWYSPLLKYVSIGNDKHVRAGHAALVLIKKSTGELEYHDFGRYITPEPMGRVRGKETDFELDFPLKANIVEDKITNLEDILKFLATHPKLTHGDGKLYASVCNAVNYQNTRDHITKMQGKGFIRYAAFIKDACNCARFVTDSLIAGVTNSKISSELKRSKWFTPSTIGNVIIADTEKEVYVVSETGDISEFQSSAFKENQKLFLDRLENYNPSLVGTLIPKPNDIKKEHAQWLSGIAAGAWFELYNTDDMNIFRYRRVSPYGNVDCDGFYKLSEGPFNIDKTYTFVHYSNCRFFHVNQQNRIYRFEFLEQISN